MKAALVGYAGSGKTTLFNALTTLHRAGAQAHLGAIKVPDPRVEALAAIFLVRKVTHAEIVFVDLPGARVADLGSEAAKTLAEVAALCLVVRGFVGPDRAPPDPLRDLRDYDAELSRADRAAVEQRLDRLRKAHGGKSGAEQHELEALGPHLAAGRPLRTLALTDAQRQVLAPIGLLSMKPLLVVVNVREADAGKAVPAEIEAEGRAHGAEAIALCATLEGEIAELPPAEQPAFLESLGLAEPVRDRFIHATYHLLDLVTFFTVGDDEVRAWTVRAGDKAPRAAGTIRPELERGFTRVDVTHHEELVAARDKARPHLEGKEYVVRDGDLLRVRTEH
jgi:hypothetical protein